MSVPDEVPPESASRGGYTILTRGRPVSPMPLANGRFWPLSLAKWSFVLRTGQSLRVATNSTVMLMAALTKYNIANSSTYRGSEKVCKANDSVQSLHMSMQQLCTVVAYRYATAEMFKGYCINDMKYWEGLVIMLVSVSCHSFYLINCLQHTKESLKLLKLFSKRTLDTAETRAKLLQFFIFCSCSLWHCVV